MDRDGKKERFFFSPSVLVTVAIVQSLRFIWRRKDIQESLEHEFWASDSKKQRVFPSRSHDDQKQDRLRVSLSLYERDNDGKMGFYDSCCPQCTDIYSISACWTIMELCGWGSLDFLLPRIGRERDSKNTKMPLYGERKKVTLRPQPESLTRAARPIWENFFGISGRVRSGCSKTLREHSQKKFKKLFFSFFLRLVRLAVALTELCCHVTRCRRTFWLDRGIATGYSETEGNCFHTVSQAPWDLFEKKWRGEYRILRLDSHIARLKKEVLDIHTCTSSSKLKLKQKLPWDTRNSALD